MGVSLSVDPTRLRDALETLGSLLDAIGAPLEVAVVGGGALVLSQAHVRPTEDIDVVAVREGSWRPGSPLPAEVIAFVRDVGRAFDLPLKQTGWANDWLNASASFLMPEDLPPRFFERTVVHAFGGLCVHVPSSADLVALKVLAALRPGRGDARRRDALDLVALKPTPLELREAIRWAMTRNAGRDVADDLEQLLRSLADAGLEAEVHATRAALADDGGAE